jgi:hypothetical protein
MFELFQALVGPQSEHGWERTVAGELVRICKKKRLIVYKHRFDASYCYCIQDNRRDFCNSKYSERRYASEAAAKEACDQVFLGGRAHSLV